MPNALARISEVKILSGKLDRFDKKFRDNHSDPSLHIFLSPVLSDTQSKNCSKTEVAKFNTARHQPFLGLLGKKWFYQSVLV